MSLKKAQQRYRVKPENQVKLRDWDPDDRGLFEGSKEEGKEKHPQLTLELRRLQEVLYAEGKHPVLLVLQGMDTSGKDGTIRHVFSGVNPQGVRISSFKAPSAEELSHDYLWRVHRRAPRKGELVIFNRSHYEDVLIVRVHNLVPKKVWNRRYQQINDFERILTEEGTTILKVFLHIDLDEQKERLQARLDNRAKHWKFNPQDLEERQRWDDYTKAYEEALSRTSTEWAPWYIVPANRKWYRNLVVSSLLIETLEDLKLKFPPAEWKASDFVIT